MDFFVLFGENAVSSLWVKIVVSGMKYGLNKLPQRIQEPSKLPGICIAHIGVNGDWRDKDMGKMPQQPARNNLKSEKKGKTSNWYKA